MIGIITNPNAAGRSRDRRLAARLRAIVGADGRVFETRTLDAMSEAVAACRDLGVETIGVCGGDGTGLAVLSEVVARFPAARLPRILLLPGGRVNTVAADLGVAGTPEQLLGRFVRGRRSGAVVPGVERDLLGVGPRRGFLFGAGMAGRFFEAYYGGPGPGVVWAGVLAARIFLSSLVSGSFGRRVFAPVEAEIVADGEPVPHDRFSLILAGAIASAGLGFRPTYRAGTVPGTFHLFATGMTPARLAWNTPRVRRGERLQGSPHFDLLVREASIRFAAPQPYVVDGDLFRDTEVLLQAGPRVTILRP
jgi:diacylglycerol kinase family enzyme